MGGIDLNNLIYVKKGAKAGFLYGLTGLVYFSVILSSAIFLSSHVSPIRLNQCVLLLLILGFVLFFPMYGISFLLNILMPSIDTGLSFCLFPLSGAFIGAVYGILMDSFGIKKEGNEETDKEIFTRISIGKNRQIAVREVTVNKFVISGIALWAVIFVFYLVFVGTAPVQ